MQIDHIPLGQLSVAAINMRRGRKVPDVSDILPSVKARGVLSPLFVRPAACPAREEGAPHHFEILAGRRRYFASLEAARALSEERSLPCIVIGTGDDAEALEISMIENLLREDPDEVTQWESFTRLVPEGRRLEDIAATVALTDPKVTRMAPRPARAAQNTPCRRRAARTRGGSINPAPCGNRAEAPILCQDQA